MRISDYNYYNFVIYNICNYNYIYIDIYNILSYITYDILYIIYIYICICVCGCVCVIINGMPNGPKNFSDDPKMGEIHGKSMRKSSYNPFFGGKKVMI